MKHSALQAGNSSEYSITFHCLSSTCMTFTFTACSNVCILLQEKQLFERVDCWTLKVSCYHTNACFRKANMKTRTGHGVVFVPTSSSQTAIKTFAYLQSVTKEFLIRFQ